MPDEGELARLSDQKADDWRSISDVNPALFAVAGALFAAGASQRNALVVALAPLPLFLGVFHMVRHAKLQLQMITYLAARDGGDGWEGAVARVRPKVWGELNDRGRLAKWRNRWPLDRHRPLLNAVERALRPSAWNTWLIISVVVAVLANCVSFAAAYDHALWGGLAGVAVSVVLAIVVERQASSIEGERELWATAWDEYLAERSKKAEPHNA